MDKIAKVFLIKFWDGQDAHPTRKKDFCGMGILPVLAIFAIWSIGNQITGTQYTVYKVQAKNSDAQVDKSGGYRLIDRVESPNQVVLHLIYAKSEQANVSAEEIQTAIAEYQVDPDN